MQTYVENEMNGQAEMDVFFLTPDNAHFGFENFFLTLDLTKNGETKHYARVILRRAFPFDMPDRYISVLDDAFCEIGMIESIALSLRMMQDC